MSESMSIHDLFVAELQDIYHAEKQLTKALPKMAKAASNDELRDGINEHLEETYRQCERLEQIFDQLGMRAKAKPCEAMRGLIEEASEMMREDMSGNVMDVALISCAQKVEHYEIASYGTLIALAQVMGHDSIVSLLQETLEEEKQTDEKLTELAQSEINPAAMESFPASGAQGEERGASGYGRNRQQRERYAEMQHTVARGSAPAPRQPSQRQPQPQPVSPGKSTRKKQPSSRTPAKPTAKAATHATGRKPAARTAAKSPRRIQAAE